MGLPHTFATWPSPATGAMLDENFDALTSWSGNIFGALSNAQIDDVQAETGTLNVAAAINAAILDGGGHMHFPDGRYHLSTTALAFSTSDLRVTASKGARFTVDTSVVASMPEAYFVITGSNLHFLGLYLDLVSQVYGSTYSMKGIMFGLRSGIADIKIEKCRSLWPMHSVHGIHTGATPADNIDGLTLFDNDFVSFDTDVYLTGKAPKHVHITHNKAKTQRPQEVRCGGFCYFAPAVALENPSVFSEANYTNDCGVDIHIDSNIIADVVGRPLRVHNCKKVSVDDNTLDLAQGTYTSPTVSDDAITLEMLREFTCDNAIVTGGGENGIDVLSCHDGTVTNPILRRINTCGVYVQMSDVYHSSVSTPQLSGITDRHKLNNRNVTISGGIIEAFTPIKVALGQNVKVVEGNWKFWRGSTYWPGAFAPVMAVIDNSELPAYFAESRAHWINEIKFVGNTQSKYASKSCTFATSDVVTTDKAHEFETGDKVELFAAGTAATVDFPGGVSYQNEFYFIRVSATTGKLATTWTNAKSGTAIDITSTGLTTGGSAIMIREADQPTSVSWDAAYYDATSFDIELDPSFPGYMGTALFSSLGTIATSINFLFKNTAFEHVLDPALGYHSSNAKGTYEKYWPIVAQKFSDGAATWGIEVTTKVKASTVVTKGTKMSTLNGCPADGYVRTRMW